LVDKENISRELDILVQIKDLLWNLEIISNHWLRRGWSGLAFESSDVGPSNLYSKFNVSEGNMAILDGITLDDSLEIFHTSLE